MSVPIRVTKCRRENSSVLYSVLGVVLPLSAWHNCATLWYLNDDNVAIRYDIEEFNVDSA